MKNFRIVTDSFSGYEAQVKYTLFPFAWFQLNDYLGVNTWDTKEQAMDFIKQKKAGTYVRVRAHEADFWSNCQQEVKRFLGFTKIIKTNKVVWQEDATLRSLQPMGTHMLQPAY